MKFRNVGVTQSKFSILSMYYVNVLNVMDDTGTL